MSRVAVVGGGITGLTVAFQLQSRGHIPTLFEASDQPGGKIRSSKVAGISVEEGPDAFLPRTDLPLELAREVGIETFDEPAVFGAYIWSAGSLKKLPPGSPYGIPRYPNEARRAGLLSWLGAARAALERYHRRPLSGPDVSIGEFVRTRFGDEVVSNIVDPLLAGVRGGDADDMSLAASAREIDFLARSQPSLLRALRRAEPEPPRFVTPRGGLASLTDALVTRLDDVRLSTPVTEVVVGPRPHVTYPSGQDDFDAVVVTTPPAAAADILRDSVPAIAGELERIRFASLAVITLVYPPGSYRAPRDGSGFLVPSDSGLSIAACTWYTEKWPGLVMDGRQVVRCVIGRSGNDPKLARSDAELAGLAHRDLAMTMGITAPVLNHRVTRWEEAIPQYRVGHLELISSIENDLQEAGPVFLAGAGYRGSGIPDCIAQAHAVVGSIEEMLPANAG